MGNLHYDIGCPHIRRAPSSNIRVCRDNTRRERRVLPARGVNAELTSRLAQRAPGVRVVYTLKERTRIISYYLSIHDTSTMVVYIDIALLTDVNVPSFRSEGVHEA